MTKSFLSKDYITQQLHNDAVSLINTYKKYIYQSATQLGDRMITQYYKVQQPPMESNCKQFALLNLSMGYTQNDVFIINPTNYKEKMISSGFY